MKHVFYALVLIAVLVCVTEAMGIRSVSADNPKKVELAIFIRTSVVSADEVQAATDAIQTQLNRDFTPYWGIRGILYGPKDQAPKNAVPVYLENWADPYYPYSIGWHDDQPRGYVYIRSSMLFGEHWTKVLSHEIIEILTNTKADQVVVWDPTHLVAAEAADPVESEEYLIGGIWVSDFVTPAWFYLDKGKVMDHMQTLRNPHEMGMGGYIPKFELRTKP